MSVIIWRQAFETLRQALGIGINERVLTDRNTATVGNKDFDSTNKFTSVGLKFFGFFTGAHSGTSNTRRFYGINDANVSSLTEADFAAIFDYALTLKRIRYIVSGNTKNANTIISFRNDGVDIDDLTINAGQNLIHDSGPINISINAGAKLAWKMDASASASGTIIVFFYAAWEAILIQ
jgi:hypothetical protein